MKRYLSFLISFALCLWLAGCGVSAAALNDTTEEKTETSVAAEEIPVADGNITLSDNGSKADGPNVIVDGNTVTITAAGTYRLTGTLTDGQVIVDAQDAKVTLLLEGVNITSKGGAAIYVAEADKVTVFLSEGSENTLSSVGEYTDPEGKIDAAVFSRDDLTIRGSGALTVAGETGHGIVSKDDLEIKNGAVNVTAAKKGLAGNDSVEITDGTVTVTAGTDAVHAENTEDAEKGTVTIEGGTITLTAGNDGVDASGEVLLSGGTVYITSGTAMSDTDSGKGVKSDRDITISGGTLAINAQDDGVHADVSLTIAGGQIAVASADDGLHAAELLQIDGGRIALAAVEGLEATCIRINDGTIQIQASDDGINAARKSGAYTPTVEINGGDITIEMGAGDTDGIDSNGNIVVNGGTITITGSSGFDYDGAAQHNGGTIIVNGQQIDAIPNQMMGGFGGRMGGFGGDQGSFGGRDPSGGMGGGFGGRGRG